MKKILTAILALLMTTAVFAQNSSNQNNQDVKKENKSTSSQTVTNSQSTIQNNSTQPVKVEKRNKVIYRSGNKEKSTLVKRPHTRKVK